eukprot:8781806-Lingulodinium_polyedra.AAC.1
MTGASVSLAERVQGGMPDVPGAPDDFSEDVRLIDDASDRWRVVRLPGDRVRATLGGPARV